MKHLAIYLAIYLATAAGSARADGVLKLEGEGNEMSLSTTVPCTDPAVLAYIPAVYQPLFKAASIVWDGERYAACWAVQPSNPRAVVIVDETGDSGIVPRAAIQFQPET